MANASKALNQSREADKLHSKSTQLMKRFRFSLPLYILMLPAVVYLILFNYVPIYGVQIAFREYTIQGGITGSEWVGFDNFMRFFESARFGQLVMNTISITVLDLLMFPLPILLAVMLNYCVLKKFTKSVQMITYAPHFISVVVVVSMLDIFLSPSIGFVNKYIEMFGGTAINFMSSPELFKYIYVFSGVWQNIGWSSIIFIGALSSVSPELHEAAIIDGASKVKRIWNIDLPSIAPTVIIMFIMRIGSIMNLGFQKIFLMQDGANITASEVISTYVYQVGLVLGDFSYSTAIDLFNTVINITLLFIANRVCKVLSGTSLF